MNETETLYALAERIMRVFIENYLDLLKSTDSLKHITSKDLDTFEKKLIILSGFNSPLPAQDTTPLQIVDEWKRLTAIPFDVEEAITKGVYIELRAKTDSLAKTLEDETNGYTEFEPDFIAKHPYYLPIFQRLANFTSKSHMIKAIGSLSDNSISKPASERLAKLLNDTSPGRVVSHTQLLQSIEPTLEGIVRDLVGRVLLEDIVANALDKEGIVYKREHEYKSIKGVVYDFRADFVIPDEEHPKAFIEVRKSSSRHASLYAKDKMFSAINWKGKTPDMLAILVIDGPWTSQTLHVMANIFDYVVPINSVAEVSKAIHEYVDGDKSKLRWLINFSITKPE